MKRNRTNGTQRHRIRERIADAVDFSKDIILDSVLIRAVGTRELVLENYKGILEYTDKVIRIKATPKCVKVCGNGLELCNISDDMLCIMGNIDKIIFTDGLEGNDK